MEKKSNTLFQAQIEWKRPEMYGSRIFIINLKVESGPGLDSTLH